MSSNNRASLLAGLRTGGVRQPMTAAPNVSSFNQFDMPMTASVNGAFNSAQSRAQAQQQQHQQQAFQMQMMQMEILRLQALQQAQQQQIQAELIRQQQAKQQQQQQQQAAVSRQPMSAAPNIASFPNRRVSQAEQLKSQLHLNNRPQQQQQQMHYDDFQAPMTASLGGKFGGRLNPNATAFRMSGFPEEEEMHASSKVNGAAAPPASVLIGQTAVISGGTPLGMNANASNGAPAPAPSNYSPSRGDSSVNWRRSSVVGNRSSVTVTVTPPPMERNSPSFDHHRGVHRPEPLRFQAGSGAHGLPLVIVDSSEGEFGDDIDDASSSSSTKSEPMTPPSNDSVPPLTSREEATKRLYEGLGMGRAVPQTAAVEGFFHRAMTKDAHASKTSVGSTFPLAAMTTNAEKRVSSQPMRQPLGPPSGVDELTSKNFASRIRRKAIGGLGAMLDARVHRREVEAF